MGTVAFAATFWITMRFHLVETPIQKMYDGYYPGLAKEWAVDKSNNTAYFRLDPEAKYSDGNPVKATDYFSVSIL